MDSPTSWHARRKASERKSALYGKGACFNSEHTKQTLWCPRSCRCLTTKRILAYSSMPMVALKPCVTGTLIPINGISRRLRSSIFHHVYTERRDDHGINVVPQWNLLKQLPTIGYIGNVIRTNVIALRLQHIIQRPTNVRVKPSGHRLANQHGNTERLL